MLGWQDFKVMNFEFGSIKLFKEKIVYEISKNLCSYEQIEDIERLKKQNDVHFFNLIQVEEDDHTLYLHYERLESMKSLTMIKKEEYSVKLSIAQTLLRENILQQTSNFVSIHPATIFYYPMQTVKYTYLATTVLPQEHKYSDLDRYKALVLCILTNFSYETCLGEKEEVLKRGNELVKAVVQASTRQEMLLIIEEAYDFVTYDYIQHNSTNKEKLKKRTLYTLVASVLFSLTAVGMTKQYANAQQEQIVQAMEQDMEQKNYSLEANQQIVNGDYEKAAIAMEKAGDSKEDIATMYFENNQFQQAIDTDVSFLEPVIAHYYDNDQSEAILDLTLTEVAEEDTTKLETEKAIVAYDTATMSSALPFLEDEETAVRMGLAYLTNDDVTSAQKVLEKFPSASLENKIKLKQADNELAKAEEELKAIKEDDEKKDEKQQIQKDKIATLTKEIETLQNNE
ncbi:hypothetical protein [Carnobacterium viridans]|uniref:Uncharacterized membrane protein YukC n=1 Tax=Carnobacterium viridans TaxID=174587 RepID=A0A1H0XI20_9LACT|nr:hypothetical protein [Carnobacterium viridans]SDQ02563.1 Uncharacterized membrane protein YukC [Carnobacterium viridans]SDQ02670.1 Uncharacterized membrane protein YukC [Carnobacterium viridans]